MAGRPRKHNRSEIAQNLHDYVDGTDIPVLAEFCYKNNLRRDYIYEMAQSDEGLSNAIKKCMEKKEAQLEIKALKGDVNATVAIFSLKQLGWKDRQEKVIYVDPKTLTDDELEEMIKNGS